MPTSFAMCGNPEDLTHKHNQTMDTTDAHTHAITLNFGGADLGSPWWNHVHPITIGSIGNGGALHSHGVTLNTTSAGCFYNGGLGLCSAFLNRHYHTTSGGSTGNTNSSHVHTLSACNTNTANPAGTPENHTHTFSITLDNGDNHTHTYSGSMTATTCFYGYNHNHTTGATAPSNPHNHTGSGTSGTGGESPPAVGRKSIGDGLTCIV